MSILESPPYPLSALSTKAVVTDGQGSMNLQPHAGVLSEEHFNLFAEALQLVIRARRAGALPTLFSGLAPTGSLFKLVAYVASDVQPGQAVPTVARMATAVHYLPAGRTSPSPSCMLSGRGGPSNMLLTSGVPRDTLRLPLDVLQAAAAFILFGVRTHSPSSSVVNVHDPSKPLATISTHTPPALRAVTHDVPDMLDCSVTVVRRPCMTFLDVSKDCGDILGAASTVRVLTSIEPVQEFKASSPAALSLLSRSSEVNAITSSGMLSGLINVQHTNLVHSLQSCPVLGTTTSVWSLKVIGQTVPPTPEAPSALQVYGEGQSPRGRPAPVLSFTPLLLNSPRLSSPSNPAAPAAHIDAGVVQFDNWFELCRPTDMVIDPERDHTCQDASLEEGVVVAAMGSTCVSMTSTCVGQGKTEGINPLHLDGLELPHTPRGAEVINCAPCGLENRGTANTEGVVRLVVDSEEMEEVEVVSMAGSLACVGEDARTCSPLGNSHSAQSTASSEAGGRGSAACQGSSDSVELCVMCMNGVKGGCVTTEEFERMAGESFLWPEDENRSWSDLISRPGWRVGGLSKSEGATLMVCPSCGAAPSSLSTLVGAPHDLPFIDDNKFEMDATEWLHHVRARTRAGDGSPVGSFKRPDGRVLQKLDTDSLSQDGDQSCADASHLSPVSACSMMAAKVSLNHHTAEEPVKHTNTNPITYLIRRVKPSLHRKSCNAPTSPTNSVISDLTIDEELKPTLGNRVGAVVWNYLNKDSKTPETIATPQYKVTVLEKAGNGKLGAIRVERVNVPPKAKGAKSLPRRIRKGLIRVANGASSAARAVRNTASGIYYSIPRIQLRKPRSDPEAAAAVHRAIMQRRNKMFMRPHGGEDFKVEDCFLGDEAYEHGAFWY